MGALLVFFLPRSASPALLIHRLPMIIANRRCDGAPTITPLAPPSCSTTCRTPRRPSCLTCCLPNLHPSSLECELPTSCAPALTWDRSSPRVYIPNITFPHCYYLCAPTSALFTGYPSSRCPSSRTCHLMPPNPKT
jgi:hypothetical protein